jgi:transglutaminase-like putative cysteine protease
MRPGLKWALVAVCLIVCAAAVFGLVVTLSDPQKAAAAKPTVSVEVVTVPEVMTGAYKAYASDGSQMLAKTVIKNTGTEPVTNFHISYSIPGYLETTSQEDYPVILPGETVNDYVYPTFKAEQMKEITARTTAELDVNYTFDGSGGQRGTSKGFDFLGHNDFVWSFLPSEQLLTFADTNDNAALLAAYVTPSDPDINAVAKKLTGNLFTATDDETWAAAEQIYTGLRNAGFNYISEPSTYWSANMAQAVQLPSETLANQQGNCVDLSLLLASMLEAVNIPADLCLSDGHCQVAFSLPESGKWYVIEETLLRDKSVSFTDAVNSAAQWSQEQQANDTWYVFNVRDAWSAGNVPSW